MTHVMIYINISHIFPLNDDTSIYPQFCWDIMGIRQLSIYLSYPIPSHPILSYLSIHLSIWTCIYCTTNNMWWECLNMGYRIWDNSFDSEKYDKRTWILGYPMFRQPHFTTHFIPVPWDSAANGCESPVNSLCRNLWFSPGPIQKLAHWIREVF